MNTYFERPDGEYFVDQTTQPIPPADTWDKLTVNQLIEIKNNLTDKMLSFQNNQLLVRQLKAGIARCDALISVRLSAP